MSSPTCWTGSAEELESQLAELQCRYDQLVASNNATVSQLQAEVQTLQQRVNEQAEQLAWMSGGCAAGTVSELLKRLRAEHEALLHRQLDDIRSECLRICSSHALNCATAEPVNSSPSQLVDDVELSSSCVSVVDDSQATVNCAGYEAVGETRLCAASVLTTHSESDSLNDVTTVASQKRHLSPSFDLDCAAEDRLLTKSAKLFGDN